MAVVNEIHSLSLTHGKVKVPAVCAMKKEKRKKMKLLFLCIG